MPRGSVTLPNFLENSDQVDCVFGCLSRFSHVGRSALVSKRLNIKLIAGLTVGTDDGHHTLDAGIAALVDEFTHGGKLEVETFWVVVALAIFCSAFHHKTAGMAFDFESDFFGHR